MVAAQTPPGWPPQVPPPAEPGWQSYAVSWLFDQCPADYRAYDAWRRHPLALAWIATHHIDGQIVAMRTAYRQARVDLGDDLPADAVADVLASLEREGLRLRAASRAAALITDAMRGKTWVPRL